MPPCLRIALDVTYRNLVPLVNAKAQPPFFCVLNYAVAKSQSEKERDQAKTCI